MDINTASGGRIIVRGFAGKEKSFSRLSVGDLGELMAMIPMAQAVPTIFDLDRWAQTPDGANQVMLFSLRHDDPKLDVGSIAKMGSILQRIAVARAILGESLTNGEEADDPEDSDPKAKAPATGS